MGFQSIKSCHFLILQENYLIGFELAPNYLEQNNLDTYELKIPSELGEPMRSGHGAYHVAKGFMDMNNSTHFRTTQDSPWYYDVLFFFFGWPPKTIVDHNMMD